MSEEISRTSLQLLMLLGLLRMEAFFLYYGFKNGPIKKLESATSFNEFLLFPS